MVRSKRDSEVRNTTSVVSQVLAQNVKSDKQVGYTPKTDVSFRSHRQTPLSVGLALTIHNKLRSKVLVNCLSELNLGTNYDGVINLEKRIECGVVDRMRSSGGYCIPPCIRKGISVFFAIDNIDFLEDTCDGQNTLHGTVVVMNQKDTGEGELVNTAITIPDKVTPVQLHVHYHSDPHVVAKPIEFTDYEFNSESDLLKKYEVKDRSWALANHLGNDSTVINANPVDQSDTDACTPNTAVGSPVSTVGATAADSSDTVTIEREPSMDPPNISRNQTGLQTILNKTEGSEKEPTKSQSKTSIMPTWAATNSLLLQVNSANVSKTHSEVVTPLFRQAPTDYATLYTVLSLTQNISAVVTL